MNTFTKNVILLSLLISLVSCSSLPKSIGTGIAAGAASGALISHASDDEGKLSSIQKNRGAIYGAIIGGVASYFLHRHNENTQDKTRQETLFNLEKFGVEGIEDNSYAPGFEKIVEERKNGR